MLDAHEYAGPAAKAYGGLELAEDLSWYTNNEADLEKDTYFVLVNYSRQTITKGSQVFCCYGPRSNRQLMRNYGFCFANNKYNSYTQVA